MLFLGSHFPDIEEEKELQNAFNYFDRDRDGLLSEFDLSWAFEKIANVPQELVHKEVERVMKRVDVNRDCFIELNGIYIYIYIYRIFDG